MKHDPLKKFVEENKQAFDEWLPAPDVLPGVKAALERKAKESREERSKLRRAAFMLRIAVAATFVLASGITWIYLLPEGKKTGPLPGFSSTEKGTELLTGHEQPGSVSETSSISGIRATPEILPMTEASEGTGAAERHENHPADADLQNMMALLSDSLSGSARLKGVLLLAGLPVLEPAQIRVLEEKLATDPNLHVRMAAFDLLNRHSPAEEVAERIIYNLSKQEDPIMQLSLMTAAAGLVETQLPVDTFRHCLNELVHNPATLTMVKEEAAAFLFAYQGMTISTNQQY